jgi:uncharacterized metal-binding protein
MRGEFPAFEDLYVGGAREMVYTSALVEAEGYCRWTRLREVGEFARRMGWFRLGLAHCADTAREVDLIGDYLEGCGFEVVRPSVTVDCDPLGQAKRFAESGCSLSLICGMHPGHEAMFIRSSEAPVTGLIARDARLRHNPVAALYTSDGYSREMLYGRRAPAVGTFRGWDPADLAAAWNETEHVGPEESNRVREVMEFANALGARHLGLSFCVGFRNEARVLAKILLANGFRVSSACCKAGAVPKEELGIDDHQKVRPGQPEMTCNPIAQAELLNRESVQFVLVLGQCVGHDAATFAHLEAPTIALVVKDRVLAHNTVAAVYDLPRTPVADR